MTIQTQSTLLKEKVSTHTRARQPNYKKINLNKKKMLLECNQVTYTEYKLNLLFYFTTHCL